jgi:hypothetical protein
VDEPGEFGETVDLQDSNAAHVAIGPIRAGWDGGDRQECLSHRGTFAELAFGPT